MSEDQATFKERMEARRLENEATRVNRGYFRGMFLPVFTSTQFEISSRRSANGYQITDGKIALLRDNMLGVLSGDRTMSSTMTVLGIDQMSPKQRVALALEIWDSLGDDRPLGQLSPEQRTELARRDAEMEANPEIGLTWDQVRAKIEGRE